MIERADIAIGTVVRLKSGSPRFVVSDYDAKGDVVEIFGWHDRHGFVTAKLPRKYLVQAPAVEDLRQDD